MNVLNNYMWILGYPIRTLWRLNFPLTWKVTLSENDIRASKPLSSLIHVRMPPASCLVIQFYPLHD